MSLYEMRTQPDGSIVFTPTGVSNPVPTGPASRVRLKIPWVSQLGTKASWSANDCGPACLTMWLRYIGRDVTVDEIGKAAGLPPGYGSMVPHQLIAIADVYGLHLERALNVTIADLRSEIDLEQPAIVLVHYPSLPTRYDARYKSGHFVLFCGYEGNTVFYHDPYWPDTNGQFVACDYTILIKAMQDCVLDQNTPNQCVRVARRHAATGEATMQ